MSALQPVGRFAPAKVPLNSIPEMENSPAMLKLLRAKCGAYDAAQQLYRRQFFISAAAAVVLSGLKVVAPAASAFIALASLVIFVVDWGVLDPRQKRLRTLGAKFQELFDCEALQMPWRGERIGEKPAPEEIDRWARTHPSSVGMRNWYDVEVGRLPIPFARAACQRANGKWNGGMRRRYAGHLLAAALVIVLGVVVLAALLQAAFLAAVMWLVVLLPLLSWLLREWKRQSDSAYEAERVAARADRMWRQLLAGGNLENFEQGARELQNDIYDQRWRDQQMFSWVYHRYRERDEPSMRVGVAELVEEYARATTGR